MLGHLTVWQNQWSVWPQEGRDMHIIQSIKINKQNKNNCLQTNKQTNKNSVGTHASNESTLTCVFL